MKQGDIIEIEHNGIKYEATVEELTNGETWAMAIVHGTPVWKQLKENENE